MLALLSLAGCAGRTEEMDEEPGSDLTIYANGGKIWMGEETYDVELIASYMDIRTSFEDTIGEEIVFVEKEDAEFGGWTIYAVNEGEWVQEEVTDLADGQLCVACGDHGYYLMNEYEVISEMSTTEELLAVENDGRDYYALANWN